MSAWRRWRAPAALASLALLFACLKGRGATDASANDVRFAISAQVVAGTSSDLHVTVVYLDQSASEQITQVQLLDRQITVGSGTTSVPLTIDLTRCLSDPQHIAISGSACDLLVSVVLEQGGVVVDSVTIGPVTVTPGQIVHASTSVQAVGRVVVVPAVDTIAIGASVQLTDTVFGADSAVLPGAPVVWASADTNIARVSATGLVTGIAGGTTQVTATAGGQVGAAVIVVPGGSGTQGIALSSSFVQFSTPVGGTIPFNAFITVASGDTSVVSGLSATIAYGAGPTGWLLAYVSDSSLGSRVKRLPHGIKFAPQIAMPAVRPMLGATPRSGSRTAPMSAASSGVTTPATLDIVPNTTNLAAGTYTATVTVTGSGGAQGTVSVTYTVNAATPTITLTPPNVLDTMVTGGPSVTKKVVVTSTSGPLTGVSETIAYGEGASGWVTVSQSSTTAPDTLTVTATPGSVAPGTYTAQVTVSSTVSGVTPASFQVQMLLSAGGPYLAYSAPALSFSQYASGSTLAGAQTTTAINQGTGSLGTITQTGTITYYGPDNGYLSASVGGMIITVVPNTTALYVGSADSASISFSAVGATDNPVPLTVYMNSGVTYTKIVSGGEFSCGLTTAGTVFCWGSNANGALGNGGANPPGNQPLPVRALVPVGPAAVTTVTDIVAGAKHVCALRSDFALYCWGDNSVGQIGIGTASANPVTTPTRTGTNNYNHIGAGALFTCAIEGGGGANYMDCWGSNSNGQLAITPASATPVTSPTNTGYIYATVSGGTDNACGLSNLINGSLYCWGDNTNGQLGIGSTGGNYPTPQFVQLIDPATGGPASPASVTAGLNVACAVDVNNNASCWGDNTYGELGIGTTQASPSPSTITGVLFTSLSAGLQAVCGISTAGSLYCWGENSSGQLGNGGTAVTNSPTPVSVINGGGSIYSVVASPQGFTMCFIQGQPGTAECAGANDAGQLGNGTTFAGVTPTPGLVVGQPSPNGASPSRVVPRRPVSIRHKVTK